MEENKVLSGNALKLLSGKHRKRRLPATQRALGDAPLSTAFTPNGFLSKDFCISPPAYQEVMLFHPVPLEPAEQLKGLHQLRDILVDGGAPTLAQLVLAAFMARQACIRAARPVRADLAAAPVELAACLMDQMERTFPSGKGSRRDDSSNSGLGISGVGPALPAQIYRVFADAVRTGGHYTGQGNAVAGLNLCLKRIFPFNISPVDMEELHYKASPEIRALLTMALHGLPQAAPDRAFGTMGPRAADPQELAFGRGDISIRIKFAAPMSAEVRVGAPNQGWRLSDYGFRSLCAALLCDDEDAAAAAIGIQMSHRYWQKQFCISRPGAHWLLSPRRFADLRLVLDEIVMDSVARRWLEHHALIRGAM
jgi:hypothetical protein